MGYFIGVQVLMSGNIEVQVTISNEYASTPSAGQVNTAANTFKSALLPGLLSDTYAVYPRTPSGYYPNEKIYLNKNQVVYFWTFVYQWPEV